MTNTSVSVRTAFVALLALGACSSEREETVTQSPPGATTIPSSVPPAASAPVPVDAPKAKPAPAPEKAPKAETPPSVPTLGKLAPEIMGEDLDGKPIRLSDYRGKVVMLDFWGNW
jgi:hypothetical protein